MNLPVTRVNALKDSVLDEEVTGSSDGSSSDAAPKKRLSDDALDDVMASPTTPARKFKRRNHSMYSSNDES